MIFPDIEFREFCSHLMIPSRDEGLIPFGTFYGTQEYILSELAKGLEEDVHDFCILKGGRQIGGTTLFDALDLFWPQTYPGMVGMLVADDDDNRDYRRDVITEMLEATPVEYRWRCRLNNRGVLAWAAPNNSRLLITAAGKRSGSNLGRSKGVNYLHADEVSSWVDQKAMGALRASLSKRHPRRLYGWNSTARGYGPFYEMCEAAKKAVATRFIFVAWWRHRGYRITKAQKALWKMYAKPELSEDERMWTTEVKRRYRITIDLEQLAFYRYLLAEEFFGDEAMRAQEYGCLPEECFQAAGDKFISPTTIRRLRKNLDGQVAPSTFKYAWAKHVNEVRAERESPETATLSVWATAEPTAVYLVGARAAGSTEPDCPDSVATVWRLYPDRMEQVAEYASEEDATYQFAWAVLHLCAAYGTRIKPTYLAMEIAGTGLQVLNEIQMVQQQGWQLGSRAPAPGQEILDFQGTIRHYLYTKVGSLTGAVNLQHLSSPSERPMLMHGLRDQGEGYILVRVSPVLVSKLSTLQRGEDGNGDRIAGGGRARDGRAFTAALAARHFLTVVGEVKRFVAPKAAPPVGSTHMAGMLANAALNRVTGRR